MANVSIIYYSSTGNTYQVARAVTDGARDQGADVRVRKVRELADAMAVTSRPGWKAHLDATHDIPEASLDDLAWADALVFGTPTRFGLPAAQLKQFIDTAGPLWASGKLQDKVAGAFTGAMNVHGGQESTLLALYHVFSHWGAVIVPLGYTDQVVYAAGGNPYGVSFTDAKGRKLPDEILNAARYYGRRIAMFAEMLVAARSEPTTA